MRDSAITLYIFAVIQFLLGFMASAIEANPEFSLFYGSAIASVIGAEICSAIERRQLIIVEEGAIEEVDGYEE